MVVIGTFVELKYKTNFFYCFRRQKFVKQTDSDSGCMPTLLCSVLVLRRLFFLELDRYGVILTAGDRYESIVMVDGFIYRLFPLSNEASNSLSSSFILIHYCILRSICMAWIIRKKCIIV